MSSITAMHGHGWVLSSVIIIAQSDTINTEYVIGRLKKKARVGYFLSKVIFPSLYPFSGNFSETF